MSGYKIRLIKQLDSLIGKPLAYILSAPLTDSTDQILTVLIIRPGGIGDALLLSPMINSIRINMPKACITILAENRNSGSFSLIPAVDRLLLYDKPDDIFQLMRTTYDLIIDTEQWYRMSAVLARLISSRIKIGFNTNERSRMFTHNVRYSQDDYEAQSFLNLLSPLGINEIFNTSDTFLSVPDYAEKEISAFGIDLHAPFVTIFPGASISARRWDPDKFRLLVNCLTDNGISSILIGSREDIDSANKITSGSSAVNLAGKTSLAGTAYLIKQSILLVSGDSGVLHIGVGLGVPTVSLFGAGISQKWAPIGSYHKIINNNLSCSPCTLFGNTPPCPDSYRCMDTITAEQVCTVVMKTLDSIFNEV